MSTKRTKKQLYLTDGESESQCMESFSYMQLYFFHVVYYDSLWSTTLIYENYIFFHTFIHHQFMKIPHILQLYTFLKGSVRCPHCQKLCSSDEEIELVDLCDNECTFAIFCDECDVTIEADVVMYEDGQNPSINLTSHEKITQDDIDSIGKTLSSHKGSLKKLFSKSGKGKK